MRDIKGTRVLILEGYVRQSLPLAKALKQLGCNVSVLCASRLDLTYASRFVDRRILGVCNQDRVEETTQQIRDLLKTKQFDVVIPAFDYSADLLAHNKEEFSEYAHIAVCDLDIFNLVRDKLLTMKACEQSGVPCPKTVLSDESQIDYKDINLKFPVCVKPRIGSGALGFRRVDDPQKLEEIVELTKKKFGSCLIQEFIPQEGLQYTAELFVDKNGETKGVCVFAKVRWYPINGGSSTLNVTVSRPDLVESSQKLLKHLHWRGYADVDFIIDPRDGLAKVMEINPRVTANIKLCFASGVNFAEQILQDCLDLPVASYLDYPVGKYMRYLHTDLLWLLKSPQRFRCKPCWFDFRSSIDQIWSWDDPFPWFGYTLQGMMKLVRDKKRRSI